MQVMNDKAIRGKRLQINLAHVVRLVFFLFLFR